MSIQDWGSIGEFVAAVATVLTLVYLALQIRSNTRSNNTVRQNELQGEFTQMHQQVAGDRGLSELVALCREELPNDIDPGDDERILAWVNARANTCVSIGNAYRNGQIQKDMHEAYCQDFHRFLEMYPGTLPKFHFIANHYPIIRTLEIFSPLFDGTYPNDT